MEIGHDERCAARADNEERRQGDERVRDRPVLGRHLEAPQMRQRLGMGEYGLTKPRLLESLTKTIQLPGRLFAQKTCRPAVFPPSTGSAAPVM